MCFPVCCMILCVFLCAVWFYVFSCVLYNSVFSCVLYDSMCFPMCCMILCAFVCAVWFYVFSYVLYDSMCFPMCCMCSWGKVPMWCKPKLYKTSYAVNVSQHYESFRGEFSYTTYGQCLPLKLTYSELSHMKYLFPLHSLLSYTSCPFTLLTCLIFFSDTLVRRPPQERKVPGSNPACPGIFFEVESYQWLKHWHSSGYPARCLAL